MLQLVATLHVLGITAADRARTKLTTKSERGSETIEKVLWAVAVISIVGIVVAVIKSYVTAKTRQIR